MPLKGVHVTYLAQYKEKGQVLDCHIFGISISKSVILQYEIIYLFKDPNNEPLNVLSWLFSNPQVDPDPYYVACVQESCSCELDVQFLGFCTAVAAYAQACSEQHVCVNWRTPDLCRKLRPFLSCE